ncbi:MAG: N-acetylmuramoyl-L-alanine amidase [Syntrophomonadaceae bacterium]|jgi:N-acetylmuramoyl-L-alanine amidase|nr:N-acetylmuramoyl-L-alanine amidase [Syntrophomonadaceae bacterium]
MKFIFRYIIIIAFFALFSAGLNLGAEALAANGTINCEVANIRSGPGIDNALTGQIIKNTKVQITAGSKDWLQIKYNNIDGWVSAPLVDLDVFKLEVNADTANLRKGPGTNYEQAGQVKAGIILTGLERQGDWYQIVAASGEFLYIRSDLVAGPSAGNDVITAAVVTALSPPVVNSNPTVYLDNNLLSFEVQPIIKADRTLVPLRAIFEAMGAKVDWDGTNYTVTAVKDETMVQLRIGDNIVYINGVGQALDVPAQIVSDRTLAPLRFVGETFGGKVDWEEKTRTVNITLASVPVVAEPEDPGGSVYDDPPASLPEDSYTATPPSPDLNEVKVTYARDDTGISIAVEAPEAGDLKITQDGSYLSFLILNSYLKAPVYVEENIGADKLMVEGKSNQTQVELSVTIPQGVEFTRRTENGGAREIIFIGNVITGVERQAFGSSGERLTVYTLLPVSYTENLRGNTMKITLPGVKKGLALSRYTFSSNFVRQVDFTEDSSNIFMEINTSEAAKYSIGQSDNRQELYVLLIPSSNAVPKQGVIVLDAGHGGGDTGARGNFLQEKDVNLDITLRVGKILSGRGAKVEYTRTTDQYVDLNDISTYANMMNAVVFVSIHNNASTNREAGGTEVYFYAPASDPNLYMQKGEREELAAVLMGKLSQLNLAYRGVKQNNFSVLRKTTMPSALCEIAFISNPQEEQLLADDNFKQKAAQLIADGIWQYMNQGGGYQPQTDTEDIDLSLVRP